jgi:hypothetical protein
MIRRLYRETALVIRRAMSESYDDTYAAAVSDVAKGIADSFKNHDPNYRYDSWFEVCGLDAWGECLPNPVHPEPDNG